MHPKPAETCTHKCPLPMQKQPCLGVGVVITHMGSPRARGRLVRSSSSSLGPEVDPMMEGRWRDKGTEGKDGGGGGSEQRLLEAAFYLAAAFPPLQPSPPLPVASPLPGAAPDFSMSFPKFFNLCGHHSPGENNLRARPPATRIQQPPALASLMVKAGW